MATLNNSRYRFLREALHSEGGFRPRVVFDSSGNPASVAESYLVPYPRESDVRFARRNQVAWYVSDLKRACSRFAGYLSKRPPLRDIKGNPFADIFLGNCDWKDTDLDVFWHSFAIESRARGCMLLLVDMPRQLPDDAASQAEQRAIPYLVQIAPEAVKSFELGPDGRFDSVSINDHATIDGESVPVVRTWTRDRWSVSREEIEIDGDEHRLGECPVLIFSESDSFPAFGEFSEIADISKRLFNAQSEFDELLRAQTFGLLTYKVPESRFPIELGSVVENLGTSNLLQTFESGAEFIAPPAESATVYENRIASMKAEIREISLTVESPNQAESGIALQMRFQALNSSLIGFARRMEDLERRAWSLFSKWLGLSTYLPDVTWSKDFSLADVALELEILDGMQASGMPRKVIAAQQKAVIAAQFGNVENDQVDDLLTSVDETLQEGTGDGDTGEED